MTIVPPLPHKEIAEVIAGVSSTDEEPPAVGVQAEASALAEALVEGEASPDTAVDDDELVVELSAEVSTQDA